MKKAQKGVEYRIELPGGLILKSATITHRYERGDEVHHYVAVHHTVDTEGEPVDNPVRVPHDAKFTKLSGAEA